MGSHAFVATGAMVFNGARLGDACVVALGGKVHIDTEVLDGTRIPIGYIAYGRPAVIYPPDEAPTVHEELGRRDFMKFVFGVDTEGKGRAQVMEEALARYSRVLLAHRADSSVDPA